MPKKTEKKSSDNQDGKKETVDRPGTDARRAGSDDKEGHSYRIRVRDLTEELESLLEMIAQHGNYHSPVRGSNDVSHQKSRCQLKCGQLERQKWELNSQNCALEKAKKDISEYLKRTLLEKEKEMDELAERLESKLQAGDKDRDTLRLQHSQLQLQTEALTTENVTLVVRVAGLEEQKAQLMSNLESVERQLADKKEEHNNEIHSLDIKAILERKRHQKEIENHMAAMEAEVQRQVDEKIPKTTKLAFKENTRLVKATLVLMDENSILRDRASQLKVDMDILEQKLSENCVRKKAVKQLTQKCRQLQVELKDCRQEFKQLEAEHEGLPAEMEALRHSQASLSEQCSENRAQVSQLEAELQEERRKRKAMEALLQEAATILRAAQMGAPAEEDSEVASVRQWWQLLQKLLVGLDWRTLTNSTTEKEEVNELHEPAAARAEIINPAVSSQLKLGRHRPGNLGPVPRPSQKHIPSKRGACFQQHPSASTQEALQSENSQLH